MGGVRLGVQGPGAAAQAAREIAAAVRAAGDEPAGFVVQAMAAEGVEMLVGVAGDPDFGPVVACAAGGVAVELLGDVQTRLAPLTRRDAAEMVRSLRTFPLLDGYRGAPRADVPALEDLLLRVSALAAAHPEIAELDCNPVLVGPGAATVVDARVRSRRPRRRAPTRRWTADSEPRRRRNRVRARSGRAPRAMTGASSAGCGRGATPRSAR